MRRRRSATHNKQQSPGKSSQVPSASNTSREGPSGTLHSRAPGGPLPPTEVKLKLKRSRAQIEDEPVPADPDLANVTLALEQIERRLQRMEANLDAFYRFMRFDPPFPPP